MFEYETIDIGGKTYISNIETDEEKIEIPCKTKENVDIYGIDSLACVGQEMKEITIPDGIKDIKENAFMDCYNLETVFLALKAGEGFYRLDKCFYKEVQNILFVDMSCRSIYDSYEFESDRYMVIKYNNIFACKGIEYEETKSEILITALPNLEELYIPDEYHSKKVSLDKMMPGYFDCMNPGPKKMRLPSEGFSRLVRIISLEELCLSSETKQIYVPISTALKKIIAYKKVEEIYSGRNSMENLEIFSIDETISSLKHFYVEGLEASPWYKKIEKNKDGTTSYKGFLLAVPANIKNNVYIMPKDILFIRNELFKESDIREIRFNDKIKNISRSCFEDCFNLKKVVIPKNIEFIGDYAFFESLEDSPDDFVEYSKEIIFEGNKESINIGVEAFEKDNWMPFK